MVEGSPEQREEIYARTRRGFLIANYEQVLLDLSPAPPPAEVAPASAEPEQQPPAREGLPAAPALAVTELLSRVQARPRPDGGLTIDAPPEAAGAMAQMFQAMADLMAPAAR